MTSRTLSALREGAAFLADMEDASNFISTEERTKYINEGVADLYDVRLDADNGKLFAVNGPQLVNVNSSQNVDTWTLPSDFQRLVSLSIRVVGRHYPVIPADATEYAELSSNPPTNFSARYLLRTEFGTGRNEIYIFPGNQNASDIAYTYIKAPPSLSLDADLFHGTTDELEYIETYAAIKMLQKEESDVAALEFRREQLKQRIRNATKDIDANAPRRMRRLRGRYWRHRY